MTTVAHPELASAYANKAFDAGANDLKTAPSAFFGTGPGGGVGGRRRRP